MAPAPRVVTSSWKGDFRTEVQAGEFQLLVDEPLSVGGSNTGPQPTDLLLASVASCFTLALSFSANKRDIEPDHIEVEVTGFYDGPKFRGIDIVVDIGCDPVQVPTLIAAAERICYVTNTLKTDPEIDVRVNTSPNTPRTVDHRPPLR